MWGNEVELKINTLSFDGRVPGFDYSLPFTQFS